MSNTLDAKITQKKLVNKSDLEEKIKEEIKILATKAELKPEKDKTVKLQTYDLSLFISQSYFVNDGAQLYLILQPLYYTLKRLGNTEKVLLWKSKGLSDKKLATPTTTDNSLSPSINWYDNSKFCLIFKGSCLKQKNATFTPTNRINFFIVYELNTWSRDLNSHFSLKGCLFGGVKLYKNADPDKYVYTGYGIGFHSSSEF